MSLGELKPGGFASRHEKSRRELLEKIKRRREKASDVEPKQKDMEQKPVHTPHITVLPSEGGKYWWDD